MDERQSPAGFEVFVDGALKHKGSVTFKNTSRHVCIAVQDKDGNMTATVDDFRIEAFPGRKTLGLICAANL